MSRSAEEWKRARDMLLEARKHVLQAQVKIDAVLEGRIDEVHREAGVVEDLLDNVTDQINTLVGRCTGGWWDDDEQEDERVEARNGG